MNIRCAMLLVAVFAASAGADNSRANSGAVASMDRKLHHIDRNGSLAHPDPAPTELTENEVNAYFASGRMDLPNGVQSVRFQGEAGAVTATTRVDFDKLKGGTSSYNPLLEIFSGIHDVVVLAHAHGSGGTGFVHVDSVSLDNVEIPRFVLRLFVEKFLQPQYPDIGLDSRFQLPDRIQDATLGEHKLTVVQK